MYLRCGASIGPNIRSLIGDVVGSCSLSATPAMPTEAAAPMMDSLGAVCCVVGLSLLKKGMFQPWQASGGIIRHSISAQ